MDKFLLVDHDRQSHIWSHGTCEDLIKNAQLAKFVVWEHFFLYGKIKILIYLIRDFHGDIIIVH